MAITVIDDRDPIIVYTGAWTAGGTRFESNFTAMITTEKGATATIEFVGRNISVFGTIPVLQSGQGRTTATFTLDDGEATPVTTFIAEHNPRDIQYYIPMFRSPQLTEDRAHKLVMTSMSDNGGQITFDYMTVQGALTRYAVPESGMSATAKMAIIGGVLGGVILLLLGLVTALLLKQKRATAQRSAVYNHTGHSDAKAPMNTSGFLAYQDHQQSPMNTGSLNGNPSEIHSRNLASPATIGRQGSVPTLYRPPLPEMHES